MSDNINELTGDFQALTLQSHPGAADSSTTVQTSPWMINCDSFPISERRTCYFSGAPMKIDDILPSSCWRQKPSFLRTSKDTLVITNSLLLNDSESSEISRRCFIQMPPNVVAGSIKKGCEDWAAVHSSLEPLNIEQILDVFNKAQDYSYRGPILFAARISPPPAYLSSYTTSTHACGASLGVGATYSCIDLGADDSTSPFKKVVFFNHVTDQYGEQTAELLRDNGFPGALYSEVPCTARTGPDV